MDLKRKASLANKNHCLEQLILVYAEESPIIYKKISDIYLSCFPRLLNEERL